MKLFSLSAALLALLVFSGCASDDQADNVPTATIESERQERPAGDEYAEAGDTGAAVEATCQPERDQDVPSPGACASLALGSTSLDVQYGSPSKKGREVFGGLTPYGDVWRTGANEATVFKTDGPLTVGGKALPAGTYSLFTIPGETEWTVIFNSVADQWGAFEYDAGQDVLRTVATPSPADAPQEQFLISFERVSDTDAMMVLAWDDVRVPLPLTTSG